MQTQAITIGVMNSKGGVGKTTISSNISHILSCAGYKVLHVDLDPQGSSSEMFKVIAEDGHYLSKNEIISLDMFKFLSEPVLMRNYIFHTLHENLDIVPNAQGVLNTFDNGAFDKNFAESDYANKYMAMRNNLQQVCDRYDYIIIDGQPFVGSLSAVGIIASDYIVSPAGQDRFIITTISNTLTAINWCNDKFGRNTEYMGFFLNAVPDLKDPAYLQVREICLEYGMGLYIDCPIRYSKMALKAGLNSSLWLDYAKACITFPNPCKDLIKLMSQELELFDAEHIENLSKQGVDKKFMGDLSYLNE